MQNGIKITTSYSENYSFFEIKYICMKKKNKIALVLEGGGLRGVFTGGVLDCFMDNNITFDYVCGVSAGSCNAFGYIAGNRGYSKACMMQTDKNNSFFGVRQMKESHKYVNLDKVFYDYTQQYGLDYDKFINSKVKWEFVVTNIETGKPEYLTSNNIDEALKIGTASCSLPILTSPVELNGKLYLDGGMTDSVPIQHALDLGYDKVVVVATRRKGSFSKVKKAEEPIYKQLYKKYPNFLKCVKRRTKLYKEQISLCEKLEEEGKVILIRPTLPEVSRLESDVNELSLSYYHGYTKAEEYIDAIKEF